MQLMKMITVTVISMIVIPTSFAKIQNYNFSDDMCEYKTQYDDSKHSLKQIKDSFTLYMLAQSMNLDARDNDFSLISPPSSQHIQAFDQQYQRKQTEIKALMPVNLPAYQQLKTMVNRQLKDEHEFYRLKLNAFRDPKVLLTQRYGQQCYTIAQRMNLKGQELIQVSRTFIVDTMAKESKTGLQDPAWYKEQVNRFDREIRQTSNKESYAFDSLMFHWHNCANNTLPDDHKTLEKFNLQKDLFVKSKAYCDY